MGSTSQTWMGIDFGTCRSSAAVLIGHKPQPVNLGYQGHGSVSDMPTAVFIEADGTFLVGDEAVNARGKDTSRYFDRFKLNIGSHRGVTVAVGGRTKNYSWRDLIAPILKRIRVAGEAQFNNGQTISKVIVTVPAIYVQGGPHWVVMEESAKQAGFESVRLIREPHAAAVYYDYVLREAGVVTDGVGKITLVYDLGGGTFDPALIRRQTHGYEIVGAISGAEGVRCGGIFFDEKIREDFRSKCPAVLEQMKPVTRTEDGSVAPEDAQRARKQAKNVMDLEKFLTEVKHRFSSDDVNAVNEPEPINYESDYRLTRAEFYALIEPMIDDTIQSCEGLVARTQTDWKEITRIIMVGGSCNIPLVREKLIGMAKAAGKNDIEICFRRIGQTNEMVDPLFAVSLGAALGLDGPAMVEIGDNHYYGRGGVPQDYAQAVSWYRRAAEQHYPEAQYKLAKCCLVAEGTAQSKEECARWYRVAAELGHTEAQYELAELLRDGASADKVTLDIALLYSKAAAEGHAMAQYKLGECCEGGYGTKKDLAVAATLFAGAAQEGIADAQYKYGKCLEWNDQMEKAVEWYEKAGAQGHAEAQNILGHYFADKGDLNRSITWLEKAAAQQIPASEYALGLCHFEGTGVTEDKKKAMDFFLRAAKQGLTDAEHIVGLMYFRGDSVTKDYAQAVACFRKAAEKRYADSEYYLGLCHFNGFGVTKDNLECVKWFRRAAEQGHFAGRNALGVRYLYGQGVVQSHQEAIACFQKAADGGDVDAMGNLGYVYGFGIGVTKDREAGRKWYLKAAKAGIATAEASLLELSIVNALESVFGGAKDCYFFGHLPADKIENIRSVYSLKKDEHLVMIYDDTFTGGAKEGFIVTTYGIGCKALGASARYWPFEKFDQLAVAAVVHCMNIGGANTAQLKQLVRAHLPEIAKNAAGPWPAMAHKLVSEAKGESAMQAKGNA